MTLIIKKLHLNRNSWHLIYPFPLFHVDPFLHIFNSFHIDKNLLLAKMLISSKRFCHYLENNYSFHDINCKKKFLSRPIWNCLRQGLWSVAAVTHVRDLCWFMHESITCSSLDIVFKTADTWWTLNSRFYELVFLPTRLQR